MRPSGGPPPGRRPTGPASGPRRGPGGSGAAPARHGGESGPPLVTQSATFFARPSPKGGAERRPCKAGGPCSRGPPSSPLADSAAVPPLRGAMVAAKAATGAEFGPPPQGQRAGRARAEGAAVRCFMAAEACKVKPSGFPAKPENTLHTPALHVSAGGPPASACFKLQQGPKEGTKGQLLILDYPARAAPD